VPLEEVDVKVHPAKTEVRFRRAAAIADSVREAVRTALASAGFAPSSEVRTSTEPRADEVGPDDENRITLTDVAEAEALSRIEPDRPVFVLRPEPQQERIGFGFATAAQPQLSREESDVSLTVVPPPATPTAAGIMNLPEPSQEPSQSAVKPAPQPPPSLPPLDSATKFVREMAPDAISANIRPLGQLEESFIVATDEDGLLLIDQHVAHERVLFDKYRALETSRQSESQRMLIPETFDLTPAQAAAFEGIAAELEGYGFELMRLSGRTVAIKATPADLPASEARNVLSEVLDSVDAEKRGKSREVLRDEIAASLACHSAIKVNMPLAPEKMRWLIDRLLLTSSPTTCPHGRPVILRLATQDILKGFHRI
jgi:DNA mismatch repair protein MutL